VALSTAADVADAPVAEQIAVLGESDKVAILKVAKAVRATREVASREERIENIAEIAKGNTALALPARYPVILADRRGCARRAITRLTPARVTPQPTATDHVLPAVPRPLPGAAQVAQPNTAREWARRRGP
jgi:hypothetical protein